MSDFYENTDNQFRNKLGNHEFNHMPEAWSQMEKLLDAQAAATVTKGGVSFLAWAIPSAAAAVLVGIIGVGAYWQQPTNATTVAQQEPTTIERPFEYQTSTQTNKVAVIATPTHTYNLPPVANQNNTAIISAATPIAKATVANTKKAETTQTTRNNTTTATTKTTNVPTTIAAATAAPIEVAQQANTATKDYPVKKTTYIKRYQYSSTTFKAAAQKRTPIQHGIHSGTLPTFGITDEERTFRPKFKASVHAGVNAKVLKGSVNKLSLQPTVGLSLQCRLTPKSAIQTGLQYKAIALGKRNGTQETTSGEMSMHALSRVDMLEMPLVYQYYPHHKVNLQAGVKGTWLFNKELSDKNVQFTNQEIGLATFDVGALVGIEVLVSKQLSIGLQYSIGLASLTQTAEAKQAVNTDPSSSASDYPDDEHTLQVPVVADQQDQLVTLPKNMRNNDLQLLLKYTF